MDAARFLGLEPTDSPLRWRLPVSAGICTGNGFLFGGCALGAAILALEAAADRPVLWAAAQYLSYARPPSVLDIEVALTVTGHQTTQARAIARVGESEVIAVSAALGQRDLDLRGEWAVRPDVPGPADCPPRTFRYDIQESLARRVEQRLAQGTDHLDFDGSSTDGRSALWARLPLDTEHVEAGALEMSSAALAVLGDYVPFGIGQAFRLPVGGSSLDNTIRIVRLVPTDWVLLDIRIHAVAGGFGHGLVHLWAEDGTLLATASQSTIVRYWEAPGR